MEIANILPISKSFYKMKLIKDLKIFKKKRFFDKRGYFEEVFIKKLVKKNFVFSCISLSKKNVLRGLHLQVKDLQGKFLTVVKGKIFDVVIDLRKNSETFGQYFSIILDTKKKSSIYIPEGCAHGFCSLEEDSIVYYLCTKYRNKKSEIGIKWNDNDLNIKWPIKKPIISLKDKQNISFKEFCANY